MRIGVDFDGTIADTNTLKSAWIEGETGQQLPSWSCDRTSCVRHIGREMYERMSAELCTAERTLAIGVVDGALEAIESIRNVHELLVVTTRPNDVVELVQDWLKQYSQTAGLRLANLGDGRRAKVDACKAHSITALIDDDERHLLSCPSASVLPFLFKHGAPSSFSHPELRVYRSWPGVLTELGCS